MIPYERWTAYERNEASTSLLCLGDVRADRGATPQQLLRQDELALVLGQVTTELNNAESEIYDLTRKILGLSSIVRVQFFCFPISDLPFQLSAPLRPVPFSISSL